MLELLAFAQIGTVVRILEGDALAAAPFVERRRSVNREETSMTPENIVALRKEFLNDGVLPIRGVLDTESLRLAQEAFDWSLAHPSVAATTFSQKTPGKFYQDLANPIAFPAYCGLLEHSPVADVAAALWGAREVWFMYEQVFLKEGGAARRTPWHQDLSYLPVAGEQLMVMWISFDPVAKQDALEFVRGSHRGVLYDGSSFDPDDDTAPLYADGGMPRLPNIEADRASWDIVSWATQPGDVVCFHPAMLHGGASTNPGLRRRTLSLRFFGTDAVYSPRPGGAKVPGRRVDEGNAEGPSGQESPGGGGPVFARLAQTLSAGDPFRHPGFPKVRPL
jgi:ectoine hydroxylase-related dioxygenase (phytanoyl-CoA dioxygenase family)